MSQAKLVWAWPWRELLCKWEQKPSLLWLTVSKNFSRSRSTQYLSCVQRAPRKIVQVRAEPSLLELCRTQPIFRGARWTLDTRVDSLPHTFRFPSYSSEGSLVSSFCTWSQTFVLSFLPILLAVDTVASDYALPAIGARSGLSPIRLCPCRANKKRLCQK